MSRSSRAQRKLKPFEEAIEKLAKHYLLGPVVERIGFLPATRAVAIAVPADAYCSIVYEPQVRSTIVYNDGMKLDVSRWLGVLSFAVLVLAVGGPRRLPVPARVSDLSAQLAALHWWQQLRVGELPEHFELPSELVQWGRYPLEDIAARLRAEPPNEVLDGAWTLTRSPEPLMVVGPKPDRWQITTNSKAPDLEEIFAQSLVDNAKKALQMRHDENHPVRVGSNPNSNAARARRWLITHYPLLGGLLTQFELVEDADVCERMKISVAAIQISTGEIFINPRRALGIEEAKFVVAHEVLHAGLNHSSRRQGRDPYLWNVACDFVINDWLVGMNVGTAPTFGMLFDDELRGWSADDIYLRLAADLRVRRRICTLRGEDVDMLDERPGKFFTDREDFCRRALMQGLDFHVQTGRGLLPEGLVEAIRTLNQPPIPWQVKLADWIAERFPLPQRHRSYARPSRRQSTTPDIPRPRFVEPEDDRATRTFGVIIDTSGSMERDELGKALGAIVAYSQVQGVKQVRLVYCDAQPYDEGFIDIDSLATRVQVRGRGGTVLQPAVNLLESQRDFPKDSPILIITDGLCENDLRVARDHAFLLSPSMRLPFSTRKPVFQMA
jgi:predicted metal-dependent peptidase